MEMDVNLSKISAIELVNVSSSAATLNVGALTPPPPRLYSNNYNHNHNHHHNNNGSAERSLRNCNANIINTNTTTTTSSTPIHKSGCCGVLGRLLKSCKNSGKTASSSIGDYNSYDGLNVGGGGGISSISSSIIGSTRKTHHRRTPQEIYFESRGKSCKKLLKFNGSSNKILLYPEEGWARTASSSYWTITPCWWQPNRCRIEEFMGASQRHSTKAKMVPLEQKGSLLIAGNFGHSRCKNSKKHHHHSGHARDHEHDDEFKLYLSSNISMEDYNMGYCLTGFVERRCQQTNTFQMTHFAVIKRQWPSISSDTKST